MSLSKSRRRLEKIRAENRRLRALGSGQLSDPGPWFAIPAGFAFDPLFFSGFFLAAPPADATRIGDTVPPRR